MYWPSWPVGAVRMARRRSARLRSRRISVAGAQPAQKLRYITPSTRHATQVFNGADSIFRGILVPLFGLKAQLLRRDARVLAEETTKGLTEEQKAAVVASFNEGVAKKTN